MPNLQGILDAIQHLLAQFGVNVDQHSLTVFGAGLMAGLYMSKGRSIHKKGTNIIRSILPF